MTASADVTETAPVLAGRPVMTPIPPTCTAPGRRTSDSTS
jgi:hypothetical protein